MEENKSKSTAMLVFILVLIIVLLAGFICYDKFINKSTNKEETQEKEETKTTEEEVTDVNLIRELSNKVDALSISIKHVYDENKEFSSTLEIADWAVKEVLKNELTNQLKERIILNSLNGVEGKITQEMQNGVLKDYEIGYPYKAITKEEYDKRSNDLFGKVISNTSTTINGCPSYIYDSITNKYYEFGQCGAGPKGVLTSYKYKFTALNDSAYVYVSYAYINFENGKVYKSFNLDNETKVDESDLYITDENILKTTESSFKITKDNYQDFVQYRYNFKKNSDGSYYFVNVEKVK